MSDNTYNDSEWNYGKRLIQGFIQNGDDLESIYVIYDPVRCEIDRMYN